MGLGIMITKVFVSSYIFAAPVLLRIPVGAEPLVVLALAAYLYIWDEHLHDNAFQELLAGRPIP